MFTDRTNVDPLLPSLARSSSKNPNANTSSKLNAKVSLAIPKSSDNAGRGMSSFSTKLAPQNWEEEWKYHPALVYIWKSWLNFIPVFDGKQTVDGSTLQLVPPSFPWLDQWNLDDKGILTLIMHYMPTQLSNSLSDDLHPATATRSNGDLRSTCWQLVCQSVGGPITKNDV
jgi:hypothetical protein